MNWLNRHINSYKYAVRGVKLAITYEPQMKLHLAAALFVVGANFFFSVTKIEWLITLIFIALAWMAEIINTSIEKLADRVCKEHDELIGQVKDLASGAVIIICFFAVVCAAIIYLPYIFG